MVVRQAMGWLLGLILAAALPLRGQAHCDINVPETNVCARASLLVTLHCQNDSNAAEEWFDEEGVWELVHPDGHAEKSQGSRYSTAVDLVRLEPGQEVTTIAPLTRWFALDSAGTYRVRYLGKASGAGPLPTSEIRLRATACNDAKVLAACREFLQGSSTETTSGVDLEAIGGFNSAAAVPCMAEALARNSIQFVSIVDGLARIQTPDAILLLIHSFDTGDGFVRLASWSALGRVDTSTLPPELRQEVSRALKEAPIVVLE
jgi:hypothetical protein